MPDPGFPRGGRQPIILQKCCQKLHENEIIWTEGGGSLAPPGTATVFGRYIVTDLKECSHVTKFSSSPKFGLILFCIREKNFSANGSATHLAQSTGRKCWSMNTSIFLRCNPLFLGENNGLNFVCVNGPQNWHSNSKSDHAITNLITQSNNTESTNDHSVREIHAINSNLNHYILPLLYP